MVCVLAAFHCLLCFAVTYIVRNIPIKSGRQTAILFSAFIATFREWNNKILRTLLNIKYIRRSCWETSEYAYLLLGRRSGFIKSCPTPNDSCGACVVLPIATVFTHRLAQLDSINHSFYYHLCWTLFSLPLVIFYLFYM